MCFVRFELGNAGYEVRLDAGSDPTVDIDLIVIEEDDALGRHAQPLENRLEDRSIRLVELELV